MPIYTDETCPICGINLELQYLCQDCNDVFCEDCVVTVAEEQSLCIRCGGAEITPDKNGIHFCVGCGGTEIRSIKKMNPTCPNCESQNVIKISEKQSQLIDSYKENIHQTREFIKPLEAMLEKLNDSRQNLAHLREDNPKCFHYPTSESDLLIIFKLFSAAKNNIHDQCNDYFQEIQRNYHTFIEIPVSHPSNLPYIASQMKNLLRERDKIAKNAVDLMEPIQIRLNAIFERLDFMESTQSLFNTFISRITLTEDEKIVFGISCKLSEGSAQNVEYGSKNGTILLTSKKLYFFYQQGVFKKKSALLFSVDLNDLQQIGVKGRVKKQVSLEFLNSMYKFSISKENREKLVEWIEKARIFDTRNQIDVDAIKKLEKFKLNLKSFREELENAIYQLLSNNIPTPIKQIGNSLPSNTQYSFNPTQSISYPIIERANKSPANYYSNPNGEYSGLNIINPPQYQNQNNPNQNISYQKENLSEIDRYATPAGHLGYPHDRQNFLQPQNSNKPIRNFLPPNGRNSVTYPLSDENSSNLFPNEFYNEHSKSMNSPIHPNNSYSNPIHSHSYNQMEYAMPPNQPYTNNSNPAQSQSLHAPNRSPNYNSDPNYMSGSSSAQGNSYTQSHYGKSRNKISSPSIVSSIPNRNPSTLQNAFRPSINSPSFGSNPNQTYPSGINSSISNVPITPEYNLDVQNAYHSPISNNKPLSQLNSNMFSTKNIFPNEETKLRNDMNQLRQDEFSAMQTIKMLEQQFNVGRINNVEFVKNYRELQKELFIIQEKLKQLGTYMQENYELNPN
jgi:hypothetical protein